MADHRPHRIVFSSAMLPQRLSDHCRRMLWREFYTGLYGPLEMAFADKPFSVQIEVTRFGAAELSRVIATIERYVRTRRCVAAARSDELALAVNVGDAPMHVRQLGRDGQVAPGGAALVCNATPGEIAGRAENPWLFLQVPRTALLEVMAGAEDLISRPIDARQPVMRHLRRYLDSVLVSGEDENDASLCEHVERTIVDLIALVLNTDRDARDVAYMQGLRAARLRMIVAEIGAGYLNPAFSLGTLAACVGLSPRSVQDILSATGRSFTDRVLELRLRRARTLLADRRYASRRVIDIALASGFNEVTYFNRAFRRRFGASPPDMRRAALEGLHRGEPAER